MIRLAILIALWNAVWATGCAVAQQASATETSERDYFEELPVVLSVSRLAQPLNEVPGAVTVIDRDLIRRSGAREVAEILRLVPGFLLTYRNGANPLAAYHAGMDVYGSRMQVYVDGRSLYSSFLVGDTHLGLRTIVLEDVERIEVLRGSNSASYGANAFLGVVNIVTRNAADTIGAMASVTVGDGGIDDNAVRIGWGDERASYRVTAARRSDSGFKQINDDSRISSFQLRGDWQVSPSDEFRLSLGAVATARGDGVAGSAGNPARTTGQSDVNLLFNWQRQLAENERLEVRASHERESFSEKASVTGNIGGSVSAVSDSSGSVRRTELGVLHSLSLSPAWRVAWGGEWRYEVLDSPTLYFGQGSLSLHQWRGFGTVEWRPDERWLLQASGMQEGHNYVGGTFSPRLAVGFHLTPDHSLRAGVTKSQRAPNFYELRADTRLFNLSSGNPVAAVGAQVPVVGWLYRSSGTVRAESLISNELGYLGYFRQANLKVDVRAFVERMNDRIAVEGKTVANPALPAFPFTNVRDFVNRPGQRLQGFEYQIDWRPLPESRLMFSEMHIRSKIGAVADEALEAPFRSSSLTWLQKLPNNFDASMILTASTPFKWAGGGDLINTPRRIDLRVAKAFSMGATHGEVSLTTQAINGGSQVFKLNQRFERRAFATLRLDI